MTHVIAPPPPVVQQLSDLIAFVKNVDQVAQLILDLQTATEEYTVALKALADADGETRADIERLAELERLIGTESNELATQKEEQTAKAELLATSEANLQAAYVNLQSRTDEFESQMTARTTELDNRKAELDTLLAATEMDRERVTRIKETLAGKLAAVNAAMGA